VNRLTVFVLVGCWDERGNTLFNMEFTADLISHYDHCQREQCTVYINELDPRALQSHLTRLQSGPVTLRR
jgi:hypothetical protein